MGGVWAGFWLLQAPLSLPFLRERGAPAAPASEERPQPSGLLEMGSGERDGVRVWVRKSMGTSAVALTEKKGEGSGEKSD